MADSHSLNASASEVNIDNKNLTPQSEIDEKSMASAVGDNIGRKALYWDKKANGPKWDQKPTPRLLEKKATEPLETVTITKKITKFAYSDESNKLKVYITFADIGLPVLTDHSLDFTDSSLDLKLCTIPTTKSNTDRVVIHQFEVKELHDKIEKASLLVKADKVILILVKADNSTNTWSGIKKKN